MSIWQQIPLEPITRNNTHTKKTTKDSEIKTAAEIMGRQLLAAIIEGVSNKK